MGLAIDELLAVLSPLPLVTASVLDTTMGVLSGKVLTVSTPALIQLSF